MRILPFIILILWFSGCHAQNKKNMDSTTNPLLCNPDSGVCEVPQTNVADAMPVATTQNKPVKIIYFTDPICSSCWGIEPQLRKIKLEYGNDVEIEYHMGGLLPDWSYNSGGISKPSDVAHHWDEVSKYYQMPIDGDVWLEDPLPSSYPPSIAFKAAQMQDNSKALVFLRALREMVFLEKKNITKWEHIAKAATLANLDVLQLKIDFENKAPQQFQQDLNLARKYGVTGFPTLFITDSLGNFEVLYGFRPYDNFEKGIHKIYPKAKRTGYDASWQYLFAKYPSFTAREFAELSNITIAQSEHKLDELTALGKLTKLSTKNGALWKLK
jgi:putative protein-disulfide isomerase